MLNSREYDERIYLDEILKKLRFALDNIEQEILNYSHKILETKRYIWENSAELDSVEKAANRISANEDIFLEIMRLPNARNYKSLYNHHILDELIFK